MSSFSFLVFSFRSRRPFDCLRTGVTTNARCYNRPAVKLCKQRGRAFLDNVGASRDTALVLGEAVVLITFLENSRVDARGTRVLPDLRLAKGDEVLGCGVQHAVVGRASVLGVVLFVEGRSPEDDVGFDVGVVVRLRSPSVACRLR